MLRKKLLRDFDGFVMFKMLSFYCEYTQGKLKLHQDITEKTQGILLCEMSGNHECVHN